VAGLLRYLTKWTKVKKKKMNAHYIGFEVLTAVVMNITIFWDITACGPLRVNRRFGTAYRLHLHGRKISRAAVLATCFHAGFLLDIFFDPEDGGDMFLRNVG
jgi:hypothetical protein